MLASGWKKSRGSLSSVCRQGECGLLLSAVEKLVQGEVTPEFVKSPRDGNMVFFSIEMFEQV